MLELGGLLTAGSILLVSILTPMFRRAAPWTNLWMVPELVTAAITGALAFGIALLTAGAIDMAQHGLSALHLALLVAAVAGVIVVGRRAARGPSRPAAPSA